MPLDPELWAKEALALMEEGKRRHEFVKDQLERLYNHMCVNTVKAAMSEIDARIKWFEARLNEIPEKITTIHNGIVFTRVGKEWQLIHNDRPLLEAGIKAKLEAVKSFPDFELAITKSRAELIKEIQEICYNFDKFVESK